MDSKTLKALQGSIEKWEKIVAGTGIDLGHENCPLCQKFYNEIDFMDRCKSCPVYKATGHPNCYRTPYNDWSETEDLDLKMQYAQEELEFLKSLLPKEEVELTIEKERVLELASKNPSYAPLLKKLFPNLLKEEVIKVKIGDFIKTKSGNIYLVVLLHNGYDLIVIKSNLGTVGYPFSTCFSSVEAKNGELFLHKEFTKYFDKIVEGKVGFLG